jgi:hypothetical protein
MDQYMFALDIIAKINHIDDYVEEVRLREQESESGGPQYNRAVMPSLAVADDGSEQAVSDESEVE